VRGKDANLAAAHRINELQCPAGIGPPGAQHSLFSPALLGGEHASGRLANACSTSSGDVVPRNVTGVPVVPVELRRTSHVRLYCIYATARQQPKYTSGHTAQASSPRGLGWRGEPGGAMPRARP
jgi:hypothetical protein